MVLFAGIELPVKAIREQVSSAVDLIVHMARFNDGSRHITHVTEVMGMEGEIITLQDLFVYEHRGVDSAGPEFGAGGYPVLGREDASDRRGLPAAPAGSLRATGLRPNFLDKLAVAGVRVEPALFGPDGLAPEPRRAPR